MTAPAQAQVVLELASPTAPIPSPGSASFTFNSVAAPGTLTFELPGYLSLDGGSNGIYSDLLTVTLNGSTILSGYYNMGGCCTQETLANTTGVAVDVTHYSTWGGGLLKLTNGSVMLNGGINTLTFTYSGMPQGTGDESWGLNKLVVTALPRAPGVPEPSTWALLILGFGMTGSALRASRRQRAKLAYA